MSARRQDSRRQSPTSAQSSRLQSSSIPAEEVTRRQRFFPAISSERPHSTSIPLEALPRRQQPFSTPSQSNRPHSTSMDDPPISPLSPSERPHSGSNLLQEFSRRQQRFSTPPQSVRSPSSVARDESGRRHPYSTPPRSQMSPSSPIPLEELSSRRHDPNPVQRRVHMAPTPLRDDIISGMPSEAHDAALLDRSLSSEQFIEQHIANIVSDMEKDENLMEDNPVSEQLRLAMLREMPEPLTLKRTVRRKLLKTVSQKSKHSPINFRKRLKYRIGISASKFKRAIKNILYSFELWYASVKEIEGHYGSGVATYFKFFRWLFILNCIVFIMSFSFVVIPQILYDFLDVHTGNSEETQNSTDVGEPDTNYTTPEAAALRFEELSPTSMLPVSAPLLFYTQRSSAATINCSKKGDFSVGNLFTGEGFFTNTSLYYGYYTNDTLEFIPGLYYSIPMAYFFTAICCYLFIFLSLSVSMAKSYRKSFIETAGGLKNIYAHKIFCGWDFSVATKEAAHLKSKSIFNELKELLSEDTKYYEPRTFLGNFYFTVVKLAVHALSLIILVGTGTVIWYMLNADPEIHIMMTALIVTIILMIAPVIFSLLVKFEEYNNPRTALFLTLFRTFCLEIIIVGVLVAFWLRGTSGSCPCWETSLGQQVYRLIMMDFLIAIVGVGLSEFVRRRIYETYWQRIGVPEFDIARNTLNLIYNQTLFFIGFFFSPLVSLIIVIKMFITFYIKKFGVLKNCQPSVRSWRAAQTQTVFLVMSFLSLLGVIIAYGYILTRVSASDCGPFRGYENMYQMIIEGVFQLKQNSDFFKVIMFVTKPGVVGFVIVAMCVGVYYLRAQSQAQIYMVNMLQEMLLLEARDKEFLISNLSKVTHGN